MENNEERDEKVLIDLKKVPLASERKEIAQKRKKGFLIVLVCLFFFLLGALLTRIFFPAQSIIYNGYDASGVTEIEQIMERYWLYGDQYEDLHQELEDICYY